MMSARYKAITLLVLVSFLYGNVLWAVDLQQAYKLASRSGVPQVVKLLKGSADVPPDGALIGKIMDESGQIITEYITGEIQGDYLLLWDTRTYDKKLIARIRCKREFVKEDMINELATLLKESRLPSDSIERRYIEAIIGYSTSTNVSFYVLKEDVKNIYGFANEDIFCLYEPFLIIPAGFFHEAGESFFRSDVYRRFLEKEIGQKIDWQRYKGKARVVVDGEERLIPAHTYLRGLGKKAREKERRLTEAERLLPKRKGLEDLLFGRENLAVSKMIREQKRITQALAELVQELKGQLRFFPGRDDKDLSRYHPLSVINRVRDWDKRLPVLDYQKVGEYPKRLIELEKALTLCAVGWEEAMDANYGTLVTPAGMPAINLMVDSAIERKGLGPRSEIIVIEPPYGCTKNLFERWQRMGFLVHSISVDEIKKKLPDLINNKTAVIYLESVTNPNLMMPDIEYVVKTNNGRAAVLVDDTFATTEMAKTLELGVDMVMLGLTKGMTGTGNIISGAVTAKKEWLSLLARNRNGIPEDKEISRAIRGLRHLEVRFAAQSRNAKRVIERIRRDEHVTSAVYPGNGHMIYHVFKDLRNAQDFIDLLAKFRTVINAVSLGQVRNLFERASGGTHVTVSKTDQAKGRISPTGIRGSVGIEDVQDVLREIDAMLKIISVYGGYTMPREDLDDFQKIFMSEYLTKEEDKRKTRYLLPKWPIPGAGFRELVSDLADTEKDRLTAKYDTDKRFRKAVDIIIKATEITQYDPVTIAIHHRLLWCLLSGNHNAVIGSPDESTTTHKETDQHMQETFFSILMGVKKGLPPIGNYTLYSRLGKPGICTFELLMTLLEVGIPKALDYEYIGTSFYTEQMAYSAFLGQQAEIIMINEMMKVIQRKENVELRNTLLNIARRETGDPEVDSYIDAEYGALIEEHLRGAGSREILPKLLEDVRLRDPVAYNRFQLEVKAKIKERGLEILIITPRDSVLYKEAKRIEQTDILKFRYIHPEDIDNLKEEVSRKTLLVYFDSLRMRDYDPAKIRDIVRSKNPKCLFGITDSFNLGYVDPRSERDFDFITHVVYYEKSDKGAVVIARNDRPLLHVWNNPFWSRKNRGVATSEDNAFDMIWYILPYLKVFDERYDENLEAVIKLLSDLVIVRRIDKRHLEIKFKDIDAMQRFLSIALKSKLIDVSIASQDEYFCINEWTSLRLKDPKSLILRIGVEATEDLVKEFKDMIAKFKKKDMGVIVRGSCVDGKYVISLLEQSA